MSTSQTPADESNDALLTRRLETFQDWRFGLMLHWAPYSLWGCIESWPLVEKDEWARPDDLAAWTGRGRDIDRFRHDYWLLNRRFDPAAFDPESWAAAAGRAGMKYVVFTTKHHDGFSLWDTGQTEYRVTAPECPYSRRPRPDIVREVFEAFRTSGFGIGAYYSKPDWHHPDFWSPEAPATTRHPNYDAAEQPEKWERFVRFVHVQIDELMTGYGEIDILWLDGGWVRPPKLDLRMAEIAARARVRHPGLIVVDRTVGGEFENYRTPEQEVPQHPLPYVWESCITMGDQWSYKPDDRYKSTRDLLHLLVDVVAKGGNLLLNVGPQPDGRLPEPALTRLREIGDWMAVHGEAIHGTRPLPPYKEGPVALTRKGDVIYAIYLRREGEPLPEEITLGCVRPAPGTPVRFLGLETPAGWTAEGEGIRIPLPREWVQDAPIEHAFALRIG